MEYQHFQTRAEIRPWQMTNGMYCYLDRVRLISDDYGIWRNLGEDKMMSELEFYDRHQDGNEVFRGEDIVTSTERRHEKTVQQLQMGVIPNIGPLVEYIMFTQARGLMTVNFAKESIRTTQDFLVENGMTDLWEGVSYEEMFKEWAWKAFTDNATSNELYTLMNDRSIKWIFLTTPAEFPFCRGDSPVIVEGGREADVLPKGVGLSGILLPVSPKLTLYGFVEERVNKKKYENFKRRLISSKEGDHVTCPNHIRSWLCLTQVSSSFSKILYPHRIYTDIPFLKSKQCLFHSHKMPELIGKAFNDEVGPLLRNFKNKLDSLKENEHKYLHEQRNRPSRT